MTSIFTRALGPDFERLHPRLQERFGFGSAEGIACVGTGTMDEIWRGRAFTLPFLYLGATRNILFPERGRGVPFRIENYAYVDRFGRETVTFTRSFTMPSGRVRRFDATMIYSAVRGRVIDYLGTHQHLAVDLSIRVDDAGGLRITTGSQRFCEGVPGLPVPAVASGNAEVHEWYDEEADRFRISVTVTNPKFGPLFGYRGSFTAVYPACAPDAIPATVRPMRESVRE